LSTLADYASNISKKPDGIWYADRIEPVSYPSKGNDQCFGIEDMSFWFRHRNSCILELVKRFPPPGKGPIFDVGGGNGFVAKGLVNEGWDVMLVEPGRAGARNAKKRGLQHVVCATTQTAGFRPGSLPAIGVFDVLEHIKDDVGFLKHLHDLLEPGGMLYLTVPAYNFLWSKADILAGHHRRYTICSLKAKLSAAGIKVAFDTYLFRVLPLIIFLCRSLFYLLKISSEPDKPEIVKRDHGNDMGVKKLMMQWILKHELTLIKQGKRAAFGSSCLVAGQK
jgi:SAM-dependent methyltransferase